MERQWDVIGPGERRIEMKGHGMKLAGISGGSNKIEPPDDLLTSRFERVHHPTKMSVVKLGDIEYIIFDVDGLLSASGNAHFIPRACFANVDPPLQCELLRNGRMILRTAVLTNTSSDSETIYTKVTSE